MISGYYELTNIQSGDQSELWKLETIKREIQGFKQIVEADLLAQSIKNII